MLSRAKAVEYGKSVYINGQEFTGIEARIIMGLSMNRMIALDEDTKNLFLIISTQFAGAEQYTTPEYFGLPIENFLGKNGPYTPCKIESEEVDYFVACRGRVFR